MATFLAVRGLKEIANIYEIDQPTADNSRMTINTAYQTLSHKKFFKIQAECFEKYKPTQNTIDLYGQKLTNFLKQEKIENESADVI